MKMRPGLQRQSLCCLETQNATWCHWQTDTCRNIELHVEIWGIRICIWLRPRMHDEIINSLFQRKRNFESWRSQGLTVFTCKSLQAVTSFNFMKNKYIASLHVHVVGILLIRKAYGFLNKVLQEIISLSVILFS